MFVSLQSNPNVLVNILQAKSVMITPGTICVDSGNIDVFGVNADMMDGKAICLGIFKTRDEASTVVAEMMMCENRVYIMPNISEDLL